MSEPTELPPLHTAVIEAALDAGVNPALGLAIAHQESGLDPRAVSPTGVTGLLQVTNATGAQYGQTPQTRTDPQVSAQAGMRYFRDLLDANGGDVETALMRYNGGSDPQYAQRVLSLYPRYAQLATIQRGRPPATMTDTAQGTPSLDAIDARLRQQGQPSSGASDASAPASPAASGPSALPSLDAIDARLRQQGSPAASGVASDALPQIVPSRDPSQPATLQYPSQAASPSTPSLDQPEGSVRATVLSPDQPLPASAGGTPAPTPEQINAGVEQFLKPTELGWRQVAGMGTRAALTTGGAVGGGLLAGPVGATAGGIAGGLAANRLNERLGLEQPGKPLISVLGVPITTGDVLAVAAPLATVIPSAFRAYLAKGPAGAAITEAEQATEAARQTWQQAAEKAQAAQAKGQRDLYAAAWQEAKDAQTAYRAKLGQYEKAAQAAEAYDRRTQAAQAKGQRDLYNAAWQETQDAQAAYRTNLGQYEKAAQAAQAYDQGMAGQQRALSTARGVPPAYAPTTPSWVLYEKFGDVAKQAPVDMVPMQQQAREIVASRGVLPTGEPVPVPGVLQKFVDAIQGADNTVSAQTIREQMRALGPLTRSPNGQIRGMAKQLYAAYGDALEQSAVQIPETAGAQELMQAANATFRKEMALQDLAEWFQPGQRGAVVKTTGGQLTINTDRLLDKWQAKLQDPFFAKSFTPDELQAMTRDFEQLRGTPGMPRGARPSIPPAPTAPEQLPGSAPWAVSPPGTPRGTRPTIPPAPTAPEQLPGSAPWAVSAPGSMPPAPSPVEPTLTRPSLRVSLTTLAETLGLGHYVDWRAAGALFAGKVAGPQLNYLLAKALLDPRLRPLVLSAMQTGTISPELQGLLAAGAVQAEKTRTAGGAGDVRALPPAGPSPLGPPAGRVGQPFQREGAGSR